VHCRSAISTDSSTLLTYRYYRKTKCIYGIVLDRKERSDVFLQKLKLLAPRLGNPLLPIVALAQYGVEVASLDARLSEDRYYCTKEIIRVLSTETAQEIHRRFLSKLSQTMASGLESLITCRGLQAKATIDLLQFVTNRWDESESSLSPILGMIHQVNARHCHSLQRHQERASSLHSRYTEQVQIEISLDSLQSIREQRLVAAAAQETLTKTHAILASNKDVAESQLEIAAAPQGTSMATHGILASIEALAESNSKLSMKASRDATLLNVTTVVTMLFLPSAACAVRITLATF